MFQTDHFFKTKKEGFKDFEDNLLLLTFNKKLID